MRPARAAVAAVALGGAAAVWAAVAAISCGSSGEDGDAAPAGALVATEVVAGLGPVTDLAFLPSGALVVLEKTGAVRLRDPGGAVTLAGTYEVDASSEKGLLGVAVDPDFGRTRRLFLYLSAADAAGGSDLDRHRVVSVPLTEAGTLDRSQEQVLVRGLRGPANHDGGALAVGPDGLLYVGVGDTGCNSGAPPSATAQPTNYFATCLTNGNGKILRVGLDGSIPADNPLAGVAQATACGEVCGAAPAGLGAPRRDLWAWGFRNPWRFWFDPRTGLLWVGDVGEAAWEEVTIARAGRHHGWPWREGPEGWPVARCAEVAGGGGECVDPVHACHHGAGDGEVDGGCQSITGGLIVDSASWPAAERGRYLYGDNANGRVWSVAVTPARDGLVPGTRREVTRFAGGGPVSLKLGPDGDVWVAVLPGRIVRLGPAR